jgi:hypothetical protein
MSASDRLPVCNYQIAGKPCVGMTAWLTPVAGEGASMLFPAHDVEAADVAAYVDAFAITDEECARIRSPQQN